jgi:hypothetical protein
MRIAGEAHYPELYTENWRTLGAAVALQAVRDAGAPDVWKALDACQWLCGEHFELLADRMPGDGVRLLTGGRLTRMVRRLHRGGAR